MTILLALLVALAPPPPPPPPPAQAQAPTLSVMSFNIRYDNPADGPDAWPARREALAARLASWAPDVVGLQEALRGQLDDLRRALPGYGEAGVGRDDGRTAGEYAAILFRLERLDLLESRTFWFSDTPDVPGSTSWGNRVTRICTWARFRDRRSGRTFYVYNVHLDHESQVSRERSVAALLEAVARRGRRGDPVLVTGDFNAGEDNPAALAMAAAFRDTYRVLHPADRVVGTFNGFRGDSTGAKIDFVFADAGFTPLEAAIERARTPAGRDVSDHAAVRTVVRFAGGAAPEPGADAAPAAGGTLEGIVVSATRLERRVEDQPLRVEVVEPEEVEEKLAMTPGDVAMLLNETGGLRVQSTAPSLGAAGVRIHGLRSRYTQVLADGLPLYGEAGALGILQIPPMDLLQVEILKGSASAMYGGAALGGLVNLVSRRPRTPTTELLVNVTSFGGSDAVMFAARPLGGGWRGTLLSGWHRQDRVDVDDDGWTDAAGYRRGVVRPRLVYEDERGRSLFATAGLTVEDREGGTLAGSRAPDGRPYREALGTRRVDAGVVARRAVGAGWTLTARAAGMLARHRHTFGDTVDADRHASGLVEATAARSGSRWSWLAGLALPIEAYRGDSVPRFDYTYSAPAVFAQADLALGWLAVQASARAERHSAYGVQVSPRLALLWRPVGTWSARLSAGAGYAAPTPFVEGTDAVGLRALVVPAPLAAERGVVASLDVGGFVGVVEVNATLFAQRIAHPLRLRSVAPPSAGTPAPPVPQLETGAEPVRGTGADLVARYRREPWHLVASWTYLWATEDECDGACRAEVPLNPRHTAGVVAAWERAGWRVGGELYVTGRQRLADDPYRAVSPAYLVAGCLIQRDVGAARLFLNLENIGGTRMTGVHPLVRPTRSVLTGWTTEAWGPLEGRTVNAGVRLRI